MNRRQKSTIRNNLYDRQVNLNKIFHTQALKRQLVLEKKIPNSEHREIKQILKYLRIRTITSRPVRTQKLLSTFIISTIIFFFCDVDIYSLNNLTKIKINTTDTLLPSQLFLIFQNLSLHVIFEILYIPTNNKTHYKNTLIAIVVAENIEIQAYL